MQIKKNVLLLLVLLTLVGCNYHQNASVVEGWKQPSSIQGHHRVAAGETLISIAWIYGLDYRVLAESNCLTKPYHLHVGDEIYLAEKKPCAKQYRSASNSARPLAKRSAIDKTEQKTKTYNRTENSHDAWIWPVRGPLLSRFSKTQFGQNGIDIGGALNTPIVAARSGEVVYCGDSLKSYGKLIIIRHDSGDLSAYAHNSIIMVKEGMTVKAGQTIAAMGYSGTNQVKLHFEIRRNGKPVDPLIYLPKAST